MAPLARLRSLTQQLAAPATRPAAGMRLDPDTGITYAELETAGQRGATPERVAFLEKNGFVILDDFVGHPLMQVMEEHARRIANECNAPYPQDVHKYGYIHRGVAGDSTSAIRGIYHPKFRAPCFSEFFSSPAFLEFTKSWTGLEPEQFAFGSVPLIFCSGNSDAAREKLRESWTPGGGGWHRDGRWWGGDDSQMMFNHQADEPPKDYSLEAERDRWQEWTATPGSRFVEHDRSLRPGYLTSSTIFLALVDDDCHELIPETHVRWRTPYEHDVLLPQDAKDQGVPYAPHWDKQGVLPGATALRLRAGECFIRSGITIHRGHAQASGERLTLAGGWGGEAKPQPDGQEKKVAVANNLDVRSYWQLDPVYSSTLTVSFSHSSLHTNLLPCFWND